MKTVSTEKPLREFVISYDLAGGEDENRNYEAVDKVLKKLGAEWKMQSFWMVTLPLEDVKKLKQLLLASLRPLGILREGDVFYFVRVDSWCVSRITTKRKTRK